MSFGFLGSALIEEQPELTQKTNKPIAQKKKKKKEEYDSDFHHQNQIFNQNAL